MLSTVDGDDPDPGWSQIACVCISPLAPWAPFGASVSSVIKWQGERMWLLELLSHWNDCAECLTQCVAYLRHSKNVIPHDDGGAEKGPVTQTQWDSFRDGFPLGWYLGGVLAGVKERAWWWRLGGCHRGMKTHGVLSVLGRVGYVCIKIKAGGGTNWGGEEDSVWDLRDLYAIMRSQGCF